MSLISEIAQYLDDNDVGTFGTNIFAPFIPDTDTSPVIAVRDTGGPQPNPDLPLGSPTFQIFIRSSTYAVGEAKLREIKALLHRFANDELVTGGTYLYYILAMSNGGWIGKNENGAHEFSINFEARTR